MLIVEFCNKNNYNPCGSDFTKFIEDLKTTRTLKNLNVIAKILHIIIYIVCQMYMIETTCN